MKHVTDYIAIAAFVMSLIGGIYQLTVHFSGPVLEFFPPERLLFFFDRNDDKTLMINTQMTCINKGKPGHDAMVKKEVVRFKLKEDGPYYRLEWINFEYVNYNKIKDDLDWQFISDAKPVSVKAGSGESHNTTFGPFKNPDGDRNKINRNFIQKETFIFKIKSIAKINMEFEVVFFGEETLTGGCVIDLDKSRDDIIRLLDEEDGKGQNYIQVPCYSNSK